MVKCLVPTPAGYKTPFKWPESKKFAWFENVPSKKLIDYKKSQNWVQLEGNRLVFPGGGTSFKMGVKDYVSAINKVIPLKSGTIRTVLDVGCGVASFGAALMDYNILTMSVAPRDIHEAQVQFALERGLPAMLGILSIHRLPYPSRSFDMAHCARCLVPWTNYDGMYLMEIDRVLRPGGYWVLSGPPISGKISYKKWERQVQDLEEEQATLEDLAKKLCWKKIAERDAIAIWRKPTNHVHCIQNLKTWKYPLFCDATDPDAGWYKKMEPCITPLPKVKDIRGISGGALEKWPKRLNSEPPRVRSGINKLMTVRTFSEDNKLWNRRVSHYGSIIKSLSTGKYRNIMDMNAGLGGFAAALSKYPVWVMNVVPFDAKPNTLGVIYERGLIGTYMNWCEAFSTYPRTYDLIHADGIFSMYMDKCDILDILFEMHRILRPKGSVIIRDHVDVIVKVKGIAERMRWNCMIQHSENGPAHPEKVLFVDNSEPIKDSNHV
ncbi:putative S-adenosyl-L-methionine-dependent methyltransferase [Macleaya cordata]|uniref:Methyltransferase n=1 Tax=Macleaya cordata TaxID=56857 RepID=A0A200R907_MACCD|nr:putative S-adenosyl-L-methionine-dependent methyltransferase [Macleaya cordata]